MLKEVIEKIVEAESRAESIEKTAQDEAERIKNEAIVLADNLRSAPSNEARAEGDRLLRAAEEEARAQREARLSTAKSGKIEAKIIDKATKMIVEAFLAR